MVLYSGYTEPDYKTMVFYSAPLLCLREGHFSNRSPGLARNAFVLCAFPRGAPYVGPDFLKTHLSFTAGF